MQKKNELSTYPDPYTYERYPKKFSVQVGPHVHNARQLLRAAVHRGQQPGAKPPYFLDMYRQPLPQETIDELFRKTGHVYMNGKWHRRRDITKMRRHAAREWRRRMGLPVRDHISTRHRIPREDRESVRRHLSF